LEIWMLVPCKLVGEEWVFLEEPKEYKSWLELQKQGGYSLCHNSNEYHLAKYRCLLEGYDGTFKQLQCLITLGLTIENMVKYKLELTPTALKEIGI
jgi:hypothetical protein